MSTMDELLDELFGIFLKVKFTFSVSSNDSGGLLQDNF